MPVTRAPEPASTHTRAATLNGDAGVTGRADYSDPRAVERALRGWDDPRLEGAGIGFGKRGTTPGKFYDNNGRRPA